MWPFALKDKNDLKAFKSSTIKSIIYVISYEKLFEPVSIYV